MFGINTLKQQNQVLINSVKALQRNNILSSVSDIRTMIFPNWLAVKEIDAYILFDDLYSVVSRLATSSAQIPLVAYNENTNEDLPTNDKLSLYLKSMTFEEKETMYLWIYLGECFMYKDTLQFGPNKGKLTTPFLHPAFMSIEQTVNFPYTITGYRYLDTQSSFELLPENVIYIKYGYNPTTNYNERNRGLSPIKALAQRLTRLNANMAASVSQMQNGGVPSIVYDKTPGINSSRGSGGSLNEDVNVIGQRKDSFSRFIRNSDNKGAPYFAAGEMGVLPLGLSLVELDALMQADVDFDKICNAYSVSSTLFNNKKASTESNVKEMRKDMYTNAIIPNVLRACDAIKKGTIDIFGDGKGVRPDLSKVPELQEDMKAKADGWAALPGIVINEMRVSMGQDESTDPMADKLLIKSGYQLADDLNIDVQPIDNTANDYGKTNPNNSGKKPAA